MPEFIHCLVHHNSTNFNTAVTQIFAIQQVIVIQKKIPQQQGDRKSNHDLTHELQGRCNSHIYIWNEMLNHGFIAPSSLCTTIIHCCPLDVINYI
jgi:hypothetical protein